jgi:uncharacterized 2Fe-2S/4Fe-4S cluster protein (DUF4445 family)
MNHRGKIKIDFEPLGKRGDCFTNNSILECAELTGLGINNICGGHGKCHKCKIQIMNEMRSEPTSAEKDIFSPEDLAAGWRLACQTFPDTDCKVHVPPESMTTSQRLQVEGLALSVPLQPNISTYDVTISPPTLANAQADADRLIQTINSQYNLNCDRIDSDVIKDLSHNLRLFNWKCNVSVYNNEIIAVTSSSNSLGFALDLGTTKLAGYLIDLTTGKTLASKGMENPQISHGEDIISRITRIIESPKEAHHLQKVIVKAINRLSLQLCKEINASISEIMESIIVGNTAMHHIILRLPIKQLAYSPYIPAINQSIDIKARELGLHFAQGSYVHFLPNIAGFVGSDHIAMLLSADIRKMDGLVLMLDIGTNTEVSLIDNGNITTVSCASGPAFEGGHIKDGMRAADGAIEHLQITDASVNYQTINGVTPIGICGSGIIDILAQLYDAGVVDKGGKIINSHPRVRKTQDQLEFVVVDEDERSGRTSITFTQKDIRELQLAKAAIRAGIQTLLNVTNHTEDEIQMVVLAGAFGTYIDISSAITIGMLPSLPFNRFKHIGNAAGIGAKLALISYDKCIESKNLPLNISYVELANNKNFLNLFVEALSLGNN